MILADNRMHIVYSYVIIQDAVQWRGCRKAVSLLSGHIFRDMFGRKKALELCKQQKAQVYCSTKDSTIYLTIIAPKYGTHPGGGNKSDEQPMLMQAWLSQPLRHILLLPFQDEVSSHHWGGLYRQRKVVSDCLETSHEKCLFQGKRGFLRGLHEHSSILCPVRVPGIYWESLTGYCLDHCVVICTWKKQA